MLRPFFGPIIFLSLISYSFGMTCDITPQIDSRISDLENILNFQEDSFVFDPLFCQAFEECSSDNFNREISLPVKSSCIGATASARNAYERFSKRKVGDCGLTHEEVAALDYYTFSGSECINTFLSSKGKNAALQRMVDSINSGLKKVPSYQGYVLRGGNMGPDLRAIHAEGSILTYDAFTSTSTKRPFGGSDRFAFFSKTGKAVMGLSAAPSEEEILFPSGTKFKVLKVVENQDDRFYVMKEISNPPLSKNREKKEDEELLKLYEAHRFNTVPFTDSWSCPLNGAPIEKVIIQKAMPMLR